MIVCCRQLAPTPFFSRTAAVAALALGRVDGGDGEVVASAPWRARGDERGSAVSLDGLPVSKRFAQFLRWGVVLKDVHMHIFIRPANTRERGGVVCFCSRGCAGLYCGRARARRGRGWFVEGLISCVCGCNSSYWWMHVSWAVVVGIKLPARIRQWWNKGVLGTVGSVVGHAWAGG